MIISIWIQPFLSAIHNIHKVRLVYISFSRIRKYGILFPSFVQAPSIRMSAPYRWYSLYKMRNASMLIFGNFPFDPIHLTSYNIIKGNTGSRRKRDQNPQDRRAPFTGKYGVGSILYVITSIGDRCLLVGIFLSSSSRQLRNSWHIDTNCFVY